MEIGSGYITIKKNRFNIKFLKYSVSDGNVNYEEFVTMLLHKKPTQPDPHASSSHAKRRSEAGSSKSRTKSDK